jgi:hypothetical protein
LGVFFSITPFGHSALPARLLDSLASHLVHHPRSPPLQLQPYTVTALGMLFAPSGPPPRCSAPSRVNRFFATSSAPPPSHSGAAGWSGCIPFARRGGGEQRATTQRPFRRRRPPSTSPCGKPRRGSPPSPPSWELRPETDPGGAAAAPGSGVGVRDCLDFGRSDRPPRRRRRIDGNSALGGPPPPPRSLQLLVDGASCVWGATRCRLPRRPCARGRETREGVPQPVPSRSASPCLPVPSCCELFVARTAAGPGSNPAIGPVSCVVRPTAAAGEHGKGAAGCAT